MTRVERGRVQAVLEVAGNGIYLGRWPSRREADIARDRAILKLKLQRPLRYPREARRLGAASPLQLMGEARALQKSEKTSRFLGVSWDKRTKTWRVSLKTRARKYTITGFADEQSAAMVRDRLAVYSFGAIAPLNFPKRHPRPASYETLQLELRELRSASRYRGVAYDPNVQRFKWSAQIMVDYSGVFLGRYATERDAAIAYDRAARHYLGNRAKLNLPRASSKLPAAGAEQLRREVRASFKKLTRSAYRGVSPSRAHWAARIISGGQVYYLGTFASEEQAAEAYDKAARRLHGARARLNFDV